MGSYVEYLERYVARFGLDSRTGKAWNGTELERKSRIQLGTRVLRVEKDTKTGEHLVTVLNAQGALPICEGSRRSGPHSPCLSATIERRRNLHTSFRRLSTLYRPPRPPSSPRDPRYPREPH